MSFVVQRDKFVEYIEDFSQAIEQRPESEVFVQKICKLLEKFSKVKISGSAFFVAFAIIGPIVSGDLLIPM